MPFIAIILFGILSAAFAVIIELSLFSLFAISDNAPVTLFSSVFDGSLTPFVLLALCGSALVEEASKYLFLLRYSKLILKDGVTPTLLSLLLGALFGIGFSLPEAWLILGSMPGSALLPVAGIVLIHVATSLFFAFIILSSQKRRFPFPAIFFATLFHALYNLSVLLFFAAH